jgi:hypothetical protein
MKMSNIFRLVILVVILFLCANPILNGQPSAPPGGHGLNGNQGPGGAAPVDGGSLFFLLGSISYGTFKVIRAFKRKNDLL